MIKSIQKWWLIRQWNKQIKRDKLAGNWPIDGAIAASYIWFKTGVWEFKP